MNGDDNSYSPAKEAAESNTPERAFIRLQWLAHAKTRKISNGVQHLRYFTLTDIGAYDVLLFRNDELVFMVSDAQSQYDSKTLAFCEKREERFTFIKNKLTNAESILGSYADIVGVGDPNVTSKSNELFPFDVINLDFTGPAFSSQLLESIIKTIFIQGSKTCSFTLFVTFECRPEWQTGSRKTELETVVRDNLSSLPSYKTKFNHLYPNFPARAMPHQHDLLLEAIPKIIMKEGFSKGYDMDCANRFTFVATGTSARMVSFIFECEYSGTPIFNSNDQSRLMTTGYPQRINELVNKPHIDVETALQADPILRAECQKVVQEFNVPTTFGQFEW